MVSDYAQSIIGHLKIFQVVVVIPFDPESLSPRPSVSVCLSTSVVNSGDSTVRTVIQGWLVRILNQHSFITDACTARAARRGPDSHKSELL